MVNVFADFHHGDLYYSLHLLFEKRLKMSLYRPIGLDWFRQGFWKIAEPYGNAPDTIDQFLGVPDVSWNVQKEPTQKYGQVQLIDDVYQIPLRIASETYVHKAITFEKFLSMDFDYVIATNHLNEYAYAELVRKHKPEAAYIMQLGNPHVVPRFCHNILSALGTPMPPGINSLRYHPEHHRDYSYAPPANHTMVKSFLTNIDQTPDYHLWKIFMRAMPEFTFKSHGISCVDGVIPAYMMPDAIKDSAWVWHVKPTGCGGFVDRQSLACGRPVVMRGRYNVDNQTLIKPDMFQDSMNCVDLDCGSINETVEKLRYFSDPDRHVEMCQNTAEKFKADVNFDEEARLIGNWLSDLKAAHT